MTLTNENVKEIDRIYMINGSGKDVVAKVARQYAITEAFAGSIAKVLKEKRDNITEAAPSRTITEAGEVHGPASALSDTDTRNRFLAGKLAQQVNEADARIERDGGSLAGLSLQQLEALAAARFSG